MEEGINAVHAAAMMLIRCREMRARHDARRPYRVECYDKLKALRLNSPCTAGPRTAPTRFAISR